MRIAFAPAARLLSDHDANGEALIASALLRRLGERGHECIAFCERAELSEPLPGVDVREISAEGRTAALSRINFARRIAHEAAREPFDLIHVLFPFNTHEGYTLLRGAPIVAGPINLPWPSTVARSPRLVARAANALTDRLERRMHASTLRRSSRLFVTGATSREAIPARYRDRCIELPFGVDVSRFNASPLPQEPVILFLSVLQERKGIEVLLRAMPHVLPKLPRARLVVAGDDPHAIRERLAKLAASLGVAHAVEFLGAVEPAATPALYRRARVFCQPSFGEPFGMTVIEAMASARPVVATAAGGITDAIVDRKGGRLVAPGDERLLADALIWTLGRDAESRAMGEFNRERAEQRYSLETVVDHIEQTYRELTGGRDAAAA